MSYAIIRTGGKQFPVTEGQTLRVPALAGKEGDAVEIETLVSGEGAKAKIGGGTLKASIVATERTTRSLSLRRKGGSSTSESRATARVLRRSR